MFINLHKYFFDLFLIISKLIVFVIFQYFWFLFECFLLKLFEWFVLFSFLNYHFDMQNYIIYRWLFFFWACICYLNFWYLWVSILCLTCVCYLSFLYLRMSVLCLTCVCFSSFFVLGDLVCVFGTASVTWVFCTWGCQLCVYLCM